MQYMIIDVDTDEMVDFIEISSPKEKETYETTHPEHYLLADEEVYNLDEDYEDFDDEDD